MKLLSQNFYVFLCKIIYYVQGSLCKELLTSTDCQQNFPDFVAPTILKNLLLGIFEILSYCKKKNLLSIATKINSLVNCVCYLFPKHRTRH